MLRVVVVAVLNHLIIFVEALREMLRGSRAFSKSIEGYRLTIYNAKMDGECKTQGAIRLPVLRSAYLTRLVHNSLKARGAAQELKNWGVVDGASRTNLIDNQLAAMLGNSTF